MNKKNIIKMDLNEKNRVDVVEKKRIKMVYVLYLK